MRNACMLGRHRAGIQSSKSTTSDFAAKLEENWELDPGTMPTDPEAERERGGKRWERRTSHGGPPGRKEGRAWGERRRSHCPAGSRTRTRCACRRRRRPMEERSRRWPFFTAPAPSSPPRGRAPTWAASLAAPIQWNGEAAVGPVDDGGRRVFN